MSDKKRKQIHGKTFFGEDRNYSFFLMDAKTGTRIFHEYVVLLVEAMPTLGKYFASDDEESDEDDDKESTVDMMQAAQVAKDLFEILTWDRVEELARVMLAGHLVTAPDGATQCADVVTGFNEEWAGDPLEAYTAIFYAICANYPKYVAPFMEALDDQGEDSNQETAKTETAQN